MPQVTAHHDDGTTDSVPATAGWSLKEQLGNMYRLTISLERSQAQSLNLEQKSDEIELSGVTRGVLADVETGGSTWTLVVYSPEWYATLNDPTDGGDRRQDTDNGLITTLINSVPEWSVGSIATLTGQMTFVFNHAFAHEALRRIEKNVPGEFEFESDGTVNYVDQRGSDRTGSVTLSPTNQNLEERIRVVNRGRKLDATHVRVLGAHEGEAQFFANLVPAADGATYENRVDYTTPRWSSGDPRDWDRWQNKDVMSQDTIEEEAAALGEELKESYVEVKTTVSGVDLNLGDRVTVQKPDADIDREMRVHKLVTKTKDGTPAGTVQDVTLSTRTVARQDLGADRRDIQRFNTAFQGSSVVLQGGGSIQPVDSTLNATLPFYYPSVDYEHKVELRVQGLHYRSYVAATGHDHDVSVTHPSHNHDVSISDTSTDNSDFENLDLAESNITGIDTTIDTWQTIDSIAPNFKTSAVTLFAWFENASSGSDVDLETRLVNTTTNFTVGPSAIQSFEAGDNWTFWAIDPTDVNGETVELQIRVTNGTTSMGAATTWQSIGPHTHDVSDTDTSTAALGTTETATSQSTVGFDPGVNVWDGVDQSPDLAPSNVDVLVNGSTVASNIGSGTFQTTVDLSGDLTQGAWNDIELSSDETGLVQAVVAIDSYRQIGTN